MIVLGVDPGTARLGWAVIDDDPEPRPIDFGLVTTQPTTAMPTRLRDIHHQIAVLIDRFRPEVVVVEQLFFARNVTTALAVGQARGVVLLAAAQRDISVAEYTPSEVKQAVVGYGKADKGQMQEMVRLILGLDRVPSPDDVADALALAVCHAHTSAFARNVL